MKNMASVLGSGSQKHLFMLAALPHGTCSLLHAYGWSLLRVLGLDQQRGIQDLVSTPSSAGAVDSFPEHLGFPVYRGELLLLCQEPCSWEEGRATGKMWVP